MGNLNQIPDPLIKKRGCPPKMRTEIEENEDLEVDKDKEENGGYPTGRFPPRA